LGVDPLSGFNLKGSLLDFYFSPSFTNKGDSIIRIRVNVDYYDGANIVESKRFEPYTKEHYSENSVKVDNTGAVDENGVIGETDFFIMYVETTNIDFFGSIYAKIIEAKNRGVYYL
jgi:hypothetical protein